MFIDATTAARIDRAEAELSISIAGSVREAGLGSAQVWDLGGGAAVLVRPGSPINKVIGVGFAGPLDEHVLAEVEAVWHRQGEPVRVELASVAAAEAARGPGRPARRAATQRRPGRLRARGRHHGPRLAVPAQRDAPGLHAGLRARDPRARGRG